MIFDSKYAKKNLHPPKAVIKMPQRWDSAGAICNSVVFFVEGMGGGPTFFIWGGDNDNFWLGIIFSFRVRSEKNTEKRNMSSAVCAL